MKKIYFKHLIAILFFLCCSKPQSPKLEKSQININKRIKLTIKDIEIDIEVAKTEEERAQGLMYRDAIGENQGMLFIFDKKGIYSFWMKNTKIPLSIAFINDEFLILDIQEMSPNQEEVKYAPNELFLYALEMNQGWFAKNNIKAGDSIHGIAKLDFDNSE